MRKHHIDLLVGRRANFYNYDDSKNNFDFSMTLKNIVFPSFTVFGAVTELYST